MTKGQGLGLIKKAIQKQKASAGVPLTTSPGSVTVNSGTVINGFTVTGSNMALTGTSINPLPLLPDLNKNLPKPIPPIRVVNKMMDLNQLIKSEELPYVFKDGDMHPRVARRMKTLKKMFRNLDEKG